MLDTYTQIFLWLICYFEWITRDNVRFSCHSYNCVNNFQLFKVSALAICELEKKITWFLLQENECMNKSLVYHNYFPERRKRSRFKYRNFYQICFVGLCNHFHALFVIYNAFILMHSLKMILLQIFIDFYIVHETSVLFN